ncbi:ACR3 family arsenite efflux transporter [Fuchsiella alkaliacetigena]|uniref:ACR3 family arsenite efflux transporter n=1 Tax=Fuchsiella alkaliacetigena TaxID=957042 RepID=UPI00200AFBAB|nr:ACR3 family arsenite efflux transporter [Fuchsiella alkaliacetigena]MCK8823875.1 ACR3 family arsenite efflux transporter [Fuchsiella alkaliacetigena]
MSEEHDLGLFERYLTLWVGICIVLGLILGEIFPQLTELFEAFEIAGYPVIVAIALFLMIYPIMVQTDFEEIIKAGKSAKPLTITLVLNWLVKPFTMAFIAWLFFRVIFGQFVGYEIGSQLMAGMILLGIAPCTAMVLVWGYLSKGNMGHVVVMVAINSLTMVVLYGPLAVLLLPVADVPVPIARVAFGVLAYVGLPLVAGHLTRKRLLSKKGEKAFEEFTDKLHYISPAALLFTIVAIVAPQSSIVLANPSLVLLVLIALSIQIFTIFGIGYLGSKKLGLTYDDAAPTAQIAASNHFEVAIAMAITLFGIDSGATLAAVTGMLIEVPIMLLLVQFCLKTQDWFPQKRKELS